MADFLEKHRDCGVKITLSQEAEPLGTAGPLALCQELLDDGEPFFVLNCDVACEFNLRALLDFHKSHGKVGTIMVTAVDEPAKYGKSVVVPHETGLVDRFVEHGRTFAGNLINAGVYAAAAASAPPAHLRAACSPPPSRPSRPLPSCPPATCRLRLCAQVHLLPIHLRAPLPATDVDGEGGAANARRGGAALLDEARRVRAHSPFTRPSLALHSPFSRPSLALLSPFSRPPRPSLALPPPPCPRCPILRLPSSAALSLACAGPAGCALGGAGTG
jgi:hypothetical protein